MKNKIHKLREFYDNLPKVIPPKTEFLNKIMLATGAGKETVYKWVYEGVMPRHKEQCVQIAKALEKDVNDIFPQFEAYYIRQNN